MAAPLRRRNCCSASSIRRHGRAANRDQSELGLRFRRAAVGPAGCRILRVMPSPGDAKSWAGSPDAGASDGAIVMTEIVFYQLQRQPLERVLPTLIEKSLERGWRVIVQAAS